MKKKAMSLVLCIALMITLIPNVLNAAGSNDIEIQMDGEAVESVVITQNDKAELTTVSSSSAAQNYQWQIQVQDDLWVNISGETTSTLHLSYAMIASLLKDNTVFVRCAADNQYSEAVKVEVTSESQFVQDQVYNIRKAASFSASSNSISTLNDTDDSNQSIYNIVIDYTFEDGSVASDPYTASLAAGSSFSTTVTFPAIQGYLPYVDETQKNSIDLSYVSISQNVTIHVVYKPTNVDYTVIHYQQNLDDDNYTEKERETKQGLTKSTVPEVAKAYEGFYALLYEKPGIAADGSTVVEIYYDRYYYLMNFDLDGGYGAEPIYARYGSPIGEVGTPTKAGYTFTGWSLNGESITELPETMPAGNQTYKAVWTPDDTAKVTIVFWGENADDEEYSYIKSSEVYVKPGTEFTYSEDGTLICALEEHTHSIEECYKLVCALEEHTHSESCYTCGITSHVHDTSCYAGVGQTSSAGFGAPSNPSNGYVARKVFSINEKVIYINGTWYEYTGNTSVDRIASTTCGKTESVHTHTDECLGCGQTEHTHSIEENCYELICNKTEHTHATDCYMSGAGLDSNLWTFVKSDTETIAADGSTVVNVYYDRTTFTLIFKENNSTVATIKAKWGAEISGEFAKDPFNTTYNGRAWQCTETKKYSYALQTLDTMPQFDATFNLYNQSSTTLKTIYYYVENVDANVSENTWPSSTTNFTLLKTVQTYFNYATYNEEYHEIEGYTRYSASIAGFNNNQKNFSNNTLYLYYLRNDYELIFNDGYDDVRTETVQFEAPLSQYTDYTPEVPSAYEPGSVSFAGWYLNPQCTGEEYKLDDRTMPKGNLILYAKWIPVSHTVEFYLDKTALETSSKLSTHPDLTVPHGETITVVDPVNGSYTFVGWFYMEDGVEKAFDFENMPIRKDLQVYGKWSSNVLKEYTIYYKIQDTDTEIADSTAGSGLAGVTKTFEAKGGSDLYADYQEGYFPVAKSHSLTLDIDNDANNVYTFWYVQKEAVPYTVKYLNKETGEPVAAEKTVSDNRKAVVTEIFVPISGMMPGAYQKRLVVSAEEGAVNEIIFYYKEDTTHAYYTITHYTENLAVDAQGNTTWAEYANSQIVGNIGELYSAAPMTIPGFKFDSTIAGTTQQGELTSNGLALKLYYIRNSYPYEVRYLEEGTNKQLKAPKTNYGKYGQVISESAIAIEDYEVVNASSQTLSIRIEESDTAKLNVITFYYKEKEVTINYQVVGPDGCGSVSPVSETIKVLSGAAQGSTPTANENYRFVGWYTNAECTVPVNQSWVSGSKLTPKQVNGKNLAATYYAKFEYTLADLTITKTGAEEIDENQTFIFRVRGDAYSEYTKDIDIQVVIQGNQSITICDLPVGQYTVTEETSWSWRYTPEKAVYNITVSVSGENIVEFENTRSNNKWLNGAAYKLNSFIKANS